MPDRRRGFGNKGESHAAAFLRRRGLRPIAANYATNAGEVDLIFADGETIVFIEVKTRRSRAFGYPEEAITPGKKRRLARAAQRFLVQNALEGRPIRFDAVAILARDDAPPEIVHYEGIDMPLECW